MMSANLKRALAAAFLVSYVAIWGLLLRTRADKPKTLVVATLPDGGHHVLGALGPQPLDSGLVTASGGQIDVHALTWGGNLQFLQTTGTAGQWVDLFAIGLKTFDYADGGGQTFSILSPEVCLPILDGGGAGNNLTCSFSTGLTVTDNTTWVIGLDFAIPSRSVHDFDVVISDTDVTDSPDAGPVERMWCHLKASVARSNGGNVDVVGQFGQTDAGVATITLTPLSCSGINGGLNTSTPVFTARVVATATGAQFQYQGASGKSKFLKGVYQDDISKQ